LYAKGIVCEGLQGQGSRAAGVLALSVGNGHGKYFNLAEHPDIHPAALLVDIARTKQNGRRNSGEGTRLRSQRPYILQAALA
jgi:hypothetical protein